MRDLRHRSSVPPISRRAIVRLLLLGGSLGIAACAAPSTSPAAPPASSSPMADSAKPASAPPAAQATAAPPQPATLAKVRCGLIANVFENAFLFVGHQRGLFAAQGVEPEFIDFSDGSSLEKALITGEIEMAQNGVSLLPAIEGGAEVRSAAISKPKLSYHLYAHRDITKPEDLVGKNVGVGAARTQLHLIMLGYLNEVGVSPDGINFVNAGPSTANFQAVATGKLDAGVSGADFEVLLADNPHVHILASMADALPLWPQVMLPVTNKNIRDRPDLIGATVVAYAASYRYALEHKDEVVEYAVTHMARDRDQAEIGHRLDREKRLVDPNMDVSREQMDWVQQSNVRLGIQKEIMPFERIATREFHERVIKTLGPYNWG